MISISLADIYYFGHVAALLLVSYAVGRVAGPIVTGILSKITQRTKNTLDDKIIAAIKGPLESFFFLIVFYFLLHSFPELVLAADFLEKYTAAILTLILTYLVSEGTGAVMWWYYDEGKKSGRPWVDLSLLPLFRKLTKIAIYVVGIVAAISVAGFDATGLIAVTSVIGLILGFASQETLANMFAGIALQIDRPYHYGDYIRLPSGEIAIVQKIGMRSTRLRDEQHNTVIVSNSEFAKMKVVNMSLPDDISVVMVQFELPNSADAKSLKKKIEAALSAKKPSGLMSERGFSLEMLQVKPSSCVWAFSFWVKGYQNAAAIRQIVNEQVYSFLAAKKK